MLMCGAVWAASAQPPASADRPAKVAVVQFQAAVSATAEFQRDLADIQKKFAPRQTELKNLSDEVDRLTKELETDSSRLSEAEQASRTRDIDNKKKQGQRLAEDAQTEYEHATQELYNRVAAKLGKLLTRYAQDHGYTLIVDRSEQEDQTPAVLWASPSIDITQLIVDGYNTKAETPALPKPKAPSAPQPATPR